MIDILLSSGSRPRFIPSFLDRRKGRDDFRAFLRQERKRFDKFIRDELIPFQKKWGEGLTALLPEDAVEKIEKLKEIETVPRVCHLTIEEPEAYIVGERRTESLSVYLYCSRSNMLELFCARRLAKFGRNVFVTTIRPYRDDLERRQMVEFYRAVFNDIEVSEEDFQSFVALPLSSGFVEIPSKRFGYRFWRRTDGGEKDYDILTVGDTHFSQSIPVVRKRARNDSDSDKEFEEKKIIYCP
ncbi:RolB family protein [Agrobacterium tumefaciens]|uniref:RolB family protein n=1 Tax=Agrobacterium tumefaciens TaxID=358 RepID=UPI0015728C3D|nr:hypothetical protein [Agrobacterium tumefaciens]